MRNARDDVHVTRSHKEIASIIGELGVPHVVERLTDDGYFSVGRCRFRVTRYPISIRRMTISILSYAISLAHFPYRRLG